MLNKVNIIPVLHQYVSVIILSMFAFNSKLCCAYVQPDRADSMAVDSVRVVNFIGKYVSY